MSNASFFIRTRGKVSGPYTAELLQRMVRTGELSRFHEVSADRTSWARAAEYAELFPGILAKASAAPADVAVEAESEFLNPISTVATAPANSASDRFFYSQNGVAVGPVAMSILVLLAQNGTISGDDMVWRENAESATAARQVPTLAALYSHIVPAAWPSAQSAPSITHQQNRTNRSTLRQAASASMSGGIVAGAILLICLMLPWLDTPTRAFWWWDLYNSRGDGVWAAFSTYLLLCGAALCIIGPTTKGITRGVCYVSLGGFAVLFVTIATLSTTGSSDGPFGFLVPAALAGIVGVCFARSTLRQSSMPRILLGIFSGFVMLGVLTTFIQVMARGGSLSEVPSDVVPGLVILMLGVMAALGAAITGFIGLNPAFSISLNLATRILALCGIGLPLLGIFVVLLAATHSFPNFREEDIAITNVRFQMAQAIFRIIAMWCALLEVIGVGIFELLIASSARSTATRT